MSAAKAQTWLAIANNRAGMASAALKSMAIKRFPAIALLVSVMVGGIAEADVASCASRRCASVLGDGACEWAFPDDAGISDPDGYGILQIDKSGMRQTISQSGGYQNVCFNLLAAIPDDAQGTLIAFGVDGSHNVSATYNGDGSFLITYDGTEQGKVNTCTVSNINVRGIHAWTLTYNPSSGTRFYKDGECIANASGIKWKDKNMVGSVEFFMDHSGEDVLTDAVFYAAYTHFWSTDSTSVCRLYDSYENDTLQDDGFPLSYKGEVLEHLTNYGDTEGLVALQPHRTSTLETAYWSSPLDATLYEDQYVDALQIAGDPVMQALEGVSTNAASVSVVAELPFGREGVIASIPVVQSGTTNSAYAYWNGDGTVSLGFNTTSNSKKAAVDIVGVNIWTLVHCATNSTVLYLNGERFLEAPNIKWSNSSIKGNITIGNDHIGLHPLAGMNVYAVHTDFGAGEALFNDDDVAASAAAALGTYDFLDGAVVEGATVDELRAAFETYLDIGGVDEVDYGEPGEDDIAQECVLRISEIMPKPTDDQSPGLREGMDVNGLESGWVEVENTSDKWADLADYCFTRTNRGKKSGQANYGNFPHRYVAPHSRVIFYTSERYSNSKDKAVSAFAEGAFDGTPMIFPDYGNILVWGDKVNPKKSPFVRLMHTPTDTIVDTVVIPSDIPEGWSIIVGDAADNEGTRRWLCPAPTRGMRNPITTGLTRLGPNVGPLYEISSLKKTDVASEFDLSVPPAIPGEDYVVTLPVNAVMNPDGTFTPRAADAIQSIKFVYRKDLDDTTLVTNEVSMARKETDAKAWGDKYIATIPHAYFPEPGHLMQWKVLITDGEGVEWTSPSFNNPDDGYEWYGTIVEPGDLNSASLPTWHMFASGNHLTQMDVDKDKQNLSLVPNYARIAIYDSSTSNYYDYVRIDLRGHTSASFTKKGHGLRFAKAHPLTMRDAVTGEVIEEIRKTSLISEFADPSYMRQMIASWLWRKMGNLVPFDFPVRCNLNGEFYQLAFNSERFTDELIEDVYGLDKFGYSYKNVGTLNQESTTAGKIEKKTPDDEDETNISMLLDSLVKPLRNLKANNSHADGESVDLTKFVVEKFDLPAWLNYLASARITQEMDDVWANVCAYLDDAQMTDGVRGAGTWMPLGYDFNLTFGQYYISDLISGALSGLSATNDWYKSHPLYGGWSICARKSDGGALMNGNNGFEAIYQSSKFRRLYLRRLRTLMDAELKAPGTPEADTPFMVKMREMADLMRTDAGLDAAKWPDDGTDNNIDVWKSGTQPADMDAAIDEIWNDYVVPRREHLYVTHSVTNTARDVGFGETFNAGIPEAQSPIATLAPNISVVNLSGDDGLFHDTECVVISNGNYEAVDMSGWRLAFGADFTFPAGTVCDANDNIHIVADRRAYVEKYDADLTDEVIVGNATIAGTGPIVLYDVAGTVVFSKVPETDELNCLRLHSFCGNTATGGGDEGEWFVLTNISGSASLDLAGVTVCFLKQDDDHDTTVHCHVTLENKKGNGTIGPLGCLRFDQADWAEKGWPKIQNNKQYIKIYDRYGSVCQSLKVTQKTFTLAYGRGGWLVCDSVDGNITKDDQWHQETDIIATFLPGEHGTLSGDVMQEIEYGAVPVQPDAVPDDGWSFDSWDGDVTAGMTGPATFTAQWTVSLGDESLDSFYEWLSEHNQLSAAQLAEASASPDAANAIAQAMFAASATGKSSTLLAEFIAGTDPEVVDDKFMASISFDGDGNPVVRPLTGSLSDAQIAMREYATYGKVDLSDKNWTLIEGDLQPKDFRFFKVQVRLK